MDPKKQLQLRRKIAMMNMSAERDVSQTGKAESRYLVCSTPRSGSTLLADLLTGCGMAGCPMEYFNDVNMEAFCRHKGIKSLDIKSYLSDLERRRTTPNGVFGMKAHYNQVQFAYRGAKVEALDAFFRRFSHFVVIERRDKLAQAVSFSRALHSGLWTSQHAELADEPEAPPPFDPAGITSALNSIVATELSWKKMFRRLGVVPHVVVYEDLVKDQARVFNATLAAIGILERWEAPPAPRIERQRDSINGDLAELYLGYLTGGRLGKP